MKQPQKDNYTNCIFDPKRGFIVRVEKNLEYAPPLNVYDLIVRHEVICCGEEADFLVDLRNFLNKVIDEEALE